jgi:chromosome segregation ATPase
MSPNRHYPEEVAVMEAAPEISQYEINELAKEAIRNKLGRAEQRVERLEGHLSIAKSDLGILRRQSKALGGVSSPRTAKIDQRLAQLENRRIQLAQEMDNLNEDVHRLVSIRDSRLD